MVAPRIAIIFYSAYGTNYGVAQEAARAASEAGAEVRLCRVRETATEKEIRRDAAWQAQLKSMQHIPEATLEDMEWADGYFISVPTRADGPAHQFRTFLSTLGPLTKTGALAKKAITATTSSKVANSGEETTIQAIYLTALGWGATVVTPGYSDPIKFQDGGNPYGYSCRSGPLNAVGKSSVAYQAKRLVEQARVQAEAESRAPACSPAPVAYSSPQSNEPAGGEIRWQKTKPSPRAKVSRIFFRPSFLTGSGPTP